MDEIESIDYAVTDDLDVIKEGEEDEHGPSFQDFCYYILFIGEIVYEAKLEQVEDQHHCEGPDERED